MYDNLTYDINMRVRL